MLPKCKIISLTTFTDNFFCANLQITEFCYFLCKNKESRLKKNKNSDTVFLLNDPHVLGIYTKEKNQ